MSAVYRNLLKGFSLVHKHYLQTIGWFQYNLIILAFLVLLTFGAVLKVYSLGRCRILCEETVLVQCTFALFSTCSLFQSSLGLKDTFSPSLNSYLNSSQAQTGPCIKVKKEHLTKEEWCELEMKGEKEREKYEGHICLERTDKAFLLSVCVSVFVPKEARQTQTTERKYTVSWALLTSLLISVMLNSACGYEI